MGVGMLFGRHVAPTVVRTAPSNEGGGRSHVRNLNVLQRMGLVAGAPSEDHDELACQSLTADHFSDNQTLWFG